MKPLWLPQVKIYCVWNPNYMGTSLIMRFENEKIENLFLKQKREIDKKRKEKRNERRRNKETEKEEKRNEKTRKK